MSDKSFKMPAGVVVPVVTPVTAEETLDEPVFRAQIEYLIEAKVHGLFVGGSAGEGALLTDEQWDRMVEVAHDAVRGRVALLGGAMDTATQRVLRRIRRLERIGYRHFVVTPTYYQSNTSAGEHLRLFGACREAGASMNMVAYNIPGLVGSTIATDTMLEMARRGWIRLCKDSAGEMAYSMTLIHKGKDVGLHVLVGDERCTLTGLLCEGRGIVPVCANVDPHVFVQLYDATVVHPDMKTAAACFQRTLHLRDLVVCSQPCWLSGLKYAVGVRHGGTGQPLAPLAPCAEAVQQQIRTQLSELSKR